tara:strand:+ start:75 stop:449 length:375 start_codon:yes stop_codon:yes gene_type:complete
MAYIQHNNPFPVTSCGRRRQFMNDNAPKYVNSPGKDRTEESPFPKLRKTTRGKGRHFLHADEGGGMTEAGRKAYKKENPGSTLSAPVTEKNPSKKNAARRKSFCARSRSWTSERGKAARKRWKC